MEINILVAPVLKKTISKKWLENLSRKILLAAGTGEEAELDLVITDQKKISELNKKYLGKDRPTDVISFQMLPEPKNKAPFIAPPDGKKHLGEVVISYPQAVIQAEELDHSPEKELATLVIHGVLHLMGYDHVEPGPERRQMRAKETQILKLIEKELS